MSKSNELPSKRQEESIMPETKAKTTNFTQISNEVLLDERLSFKARGILALLLSRPKNWKIYIDEIIERSDLDGKHSVRTGLKELKTSGYLELVKVWNAATGKFEGTVYQLCLNYRPNFSKTPKILKTPKTVVQKNLPQVKDFPTVGKTDLPKISQAENLSVDNSDGRKTMTPSNTKHSNTKHSNTKTQQQQTKADDDVSLKNLENEKKVSNEISDNLANEVSNKVSNEKIENQIATDFLPSLEEDEVWKKTFVGKDICKQVGTTEILTLPMVDLLLKHFTQTSISSGATYPNVTAIKRHFFNWFNANLNKNALSNYIETQAIASKKVRKQVATLMPKTDAILNKIYGQQCDNEAHLYRCLQLLETHLATYENAVNILDTENKTAVNTWIQDIENARSLVERGRKAGQLNWFYKRTTTLQSGTKNTSKRNVNQAITNVPPLSRVV
jgi:hypothetical protein